MQSACYALTVRDLGFRDGKGEAPIFTLVAAGRTSRDDDAREGRYKTPSVVLLSPSLPWLLRYQEHILTFLKYIMSLWP